jgi:DNA-binding MarR family transcriptional regulator
MGGIPGELPDAPATARLVYAVLAAAREERLTIAELVERTGSSPRGVKKALSDLRESGHVDREDHPTDGRRVQYIPADTSSTSREKAT